MTAVECPEFPAFVEQANEEKKKAECSARHARVEAHRKSLKCCWPEWTAEIGGRCEVASICAFSFKHNAVRGYYYCAPCRILEISPDGETFIVEIDYAPPAPDHCKGMNGERLRLDITDVWAPVAILHPARYGYPPRS